MAMWAEFVQEFADSVVAQSAAIARGDPVAGNRHARRYVAAFEVLRGSGDEGRDALAALLQDSRVDVRVMAAAFLLHHCEDEAKSVLVEAAKGRGMAAFGARQALERWRDGTWTLDP